MLSTNAKTPSMGVAGGSLNVFEKPGGSPTSVSETAYRRVIDVLHSHGSRVEERGNRAQAQCPAHEDGRPSLSITHGDGCALIFCFAGCTAEDIVTALNLRMADLYDDPRGKAYTYDDGRTVHRTPDKKFRQSGNTKGTPILYRRAQVLDAIAQERPVYLVEGEKDADTLTLAGVTATTAPGGAGMITRADLTPLHGGKIIVVVDRDDQGIKWAKTIRNHLEGMVQSIQFVQAATGKDASDHYTAGHDLTEFTPLDLEESLEGEERRKPYRRVVATPASTMRTSVQRFFWAERIPMGTITLLAGRGGEGKSTFGFYIAAQITIGRLPGDYYGTPHNVLIWSGEDQWETVILPRLIAAGADLTRVHKLGIESVMDGEGLETTPNLPDDLPLIREAVDEIDAKLVIIDPLTSTMRGDLNKEGDTRLTLDGLARIAHNTNTVIMGLRHFNKGGGNASDKMSGNHAFRDAARSVFLFATDAETEQRIVSQDKGNYSVKAGESFAFALESATVTTDDGHPAEVAKVVMLGDTDLSVSEIINRNPAGDDDADDRNAAQSFILDYLKEQAGQEAPAGEVIKAGRAAGFSETEMKNARRRSRDPKVESRKSGFGAGWVWGIEEVTTLEGVTKVPKVSPHEDMAPSTPSVTPSPPPPIEPTTGNVIPLASWEQKPNCPRCGDPLSSPALMTACSDEHDLPKGGVPR